MTNREILREYYGTGYGLDQLRGRWVVESRLAVGLKAGLGGETWSTVIVSSDGVVTHLKYKWEGI
jgi:hypothetical protein